MRILLTGGSGCGKSTFAQRLAQSCHCQRYYIDAARPEEEKLCLRQLRHRRLRREKGFEVIECSRSIEKIHLPEKGTAVFECLCHLTANEMFGAQAMERPALGNKVLAGMEALAEQCRDVILVTNEVGCDGGCYSRETVEYIETLAYINARLAEWSDSVTELVCGIPVCRKGVLPGAMAKVLPELLYSGKGDKQMILVTGAMGAGKRAYAQSLGYSGNDMADAVLDEHPVVYNVQNLVGRMDMELLYERLMEKEVVMINEVGSGIIPADPAESTWRVEVGKLAIRLARDAGTVVRVICGIPVVVR